MIRAAGLMVLIFALASPSASAEPKTVRIGEVQVSGKSKVCTGADGDRIARSLTSRLSKSKLLRVTGPRSRAPVDYLLTGEVLCHPKHIEFAVKLTQVENLQIVWTKVQTLDDLGQMTGAIEKVANLLVAYFKAGKMPDEAESSLGEDSPLFEHTITLFPLHTKAPGFTKQKLLASTRYLRAELAQAVKCNLAAVAEVESAMRGRKKKECVEEKCHLEIAGDLGTTKAIAARIVKTGRRCALSYTLYDVEKQATETAAAISIKCTGPGLKTGIDQLVRQLGGK